MRTKAIAVLGVLACVAAGSTAVLAGSSPASASAGDPVANQVAFDFFLSKGLTNVQAAGIVGNLDQESGMSPTAVQSGGPGRGIAQWSVGGRWDTSYHNNVQWYASTQGESASSLDLQLNFIWYELTQYSGYGLSDLEAASTVSAATAAFQDEFEQCGSCDPSARLSYANSAQSSFGTDLIPNSQSGTTVNTAGYQHIFASTTAGSIAERYDAANGWGWGSIDGTILTGSPAVNYFPDSNEYDVYATGNNGNLYVKDYVNGAWGGSWTLIDGPSLRAGVSAMLDKYGHQHVFATGTDGAVYNIRNGNVGGNGKNGSWTFDNIGGTILTRTPGVAYFAAANVYDVYATGTNGHLYVKEYDGSGWDGSWTDLGDHNFTQGAAAMVDVYGHQHVFAVDSGGAVVNVRNTDAGYDGDHGSFSFDSIGGTVLTGTPKLQYLPDSNTYHVWAAGTDGELYHKEYQSGSWWPSYHDFSGGTSINVAA
ncbi:MAG TPA: phage tail tip lysozyme [Jatrophihabitans sp.]|nr:phage tail tip lysozyme [Jatrophihabitans sp.]